MILVWLLGVWIGVSLVVGGSWMLLVDHWRRKTAQVQQDDGYSDRLCAEEAAEYARPDHPYQSGAAAGFLSGFPVAAPGSLPGSAHPPGSVKTREEPGSTTSGTARTSSFPLGVAPTVDRVGGSAAETGPPLKLVP